MSQERLLKRAVRALLLGQGLAFIYTSVAASSFLFLFMPALVHRGKINLFWSPLVRSAILSTGLLVSILLSLAAILGYNRVWARAASACKVHLVAIWTGPVAFLVTRIWFLAPQFARVEWLSPFAGHVEEQLAETLASFSVAVVSFIGCFPSFCTPALVCFALPAQPGRLAPRHVVALCLAILVQVVIALLDAPFPSLR